MHMVYTVHTATAPERRLVGWLIKKETKEGREGSGDWRCTILRLAGSMMGGGFYFLLFTLLVLSFDLGFRITWDGMAYMNDCTALQCNAIERTNERIEQKTAQRI
jgi:hypothetical protein